MDNIDEEYDPLVVHLHDCAKKAESFKTTKRRLSLQTLELIRQRGAARAAGNQELTSELARLCREAIKEDLKERRAEVLAEAAEAGKSIRYARRDFATCTRKAAFRVNIDGAMTTTTCTANGADPRDRCSGCCQSRALAAGLLTTDAAGFPSTNGNDCICCIFNKCSLR
ncbi:hypothetical protein NECAME_05491 [Necator americanus]|uniref:Uncharacterized protein n=1 Tax=Necator americanus TaxID=51031 RepID=W2SIE1_NECAM|nr:hypothetical protein NECAME_05491 [Necator americanus]ETN68646.1 hypothetical protein NECAME_05491 [Necator americanus]